MEKYRHFFDIDPDYFPAVNADVIKKNPELWKKFYPHDTFKQLLKDVVNVLTRKQKLNIWVEGAYGTGKSHAVLTLKKLLDASEEETRAYFEDFKIDNDLCNKFISAKNQGRILTVHRYGSSSIHGDNDLFLAIQESVESALKQAGLENTNTDSLKTAIVKYLSDPEQRQSFEVFVKGSYSDLFGGDSVETIVSNLKSFSGQALQTLMGKIFKVANEKQIKAFSLDDEGLCLWLNEIIANNNLSALIFIWDEFTEYFRNNVHRLTGFQTLLELSETAPFCFVAVTHQSEGLFAESDNDKKKILDRFIRPRCEILLPDNMAFQLMGKAMAKVNDPVIQGEWENIVGDLVDRTVSSRKQVHDKAAITDKELEGILPIHPYAASLLKHISTSFESNQRSMFDFIKNDRGEDVKGFQWFIDNVGPGDENPLLTVDMLWGFFYDKGKENLAHNIRMVLDYFPRLSATKHLNETELRVLKAILLFQALSLEMRDSVELFLATEKNLDNAFEGSDLENGEAVRCADKLVRDGVVYKKKIKGDILVYSILTGEMDSNKIEENKKQFESKTTANLVLEGNLSESIELPAALRLRYILDYAGATDFDLKARKAIELAEGNSRKLYAVVTFSKDANDAALVNKKIQAIIQSNPGTTVAFIDTSKTQLGENAFKDWVENKATSAYYAGKDNGQSVQYANYANDILRKWKDSIRNGQFVLFTSGTPGGDSKANLDALIESLIEEDRKLFPLGLENYKVHDPLWLATMLKVGAECGATQKVKSTYSNARKLEKALDGAWEVNDYWKSSPSLQVSKIKMAIDDLIEKTMEAEGRISISAIYDYLKEPPFGFMPCNLTAFFVGFILKEYVNDGKYSWSDGLSSDELSLVKFTEMIEEVIKLENTPNPRYRDKYIVTMTPEEKSFIEATATSFDVSKALCSSLEQARERIRARMKEFAFPIWALDNILEGESLSSDAEVISELLNLYCGIANNNQAESGKSESDIAIEIGRICINNPLAVQDLRSLLTRDKCTAGMTAYLHGYKSGELESIAKRVNDGGQYINAVRAKFDADAANWVWKKDTVDQKIDEVICEYSIIEETSKLFTSCKSFDEAIRTWSDKCNNMRLCYQAIKNDVGDLDNLLSKLNILRKEGRIPNAMYSEFLSNIKDYGENFKHLYANQLDMFKKVAAFYLSDLGDQDIDNIFKKVSIGCFTYDQASYFSAIEKIVEEYKKQLGAQKLKMFWKDKTGTESPYEWSSKFRMPILLMVPQNQIAEYRKVFGTLNFKNPDNTAIQYAQSFLESSTIWDTLNDSASRDKAFIEGIIADKAVMLPNIDEVKDYLSTYITDSPYNWAGSPEVRKRVDLLAQSKYMSSGYNVAFSKIDSMPADKVKQYLKDLIKNNMNVGIEIIKDK